MKKCLLFLLFGIFALGAVYSQNPDPAEEDEVLLMPAEQFNRFNLLFQRGLFLLNSSNQPTFAPLKNTTGSWYVGLGFKFPFFRNRVGLRLSPGVTWLKFNYETADSAKIFPDTILTHNFQRHRFTYIDLPIGIYYNITLDEDRRSRLFIEGGGFISYNTTNVLKFGDPPQEADDGFKERKTKEVGIAQELEQFRYGLYARAGWRWFGLYFSYRLSNIFKSNGSPCNENSALPPCMPVTQFGLTIIL